MSAVKELESHVAVSAAQTPGAVLKRSSSGIDIGQELSWILAAQAPILAVDPVHVEDPFDLHRGALNERRGCP